MSKVKNQIVFTLSEPLEYHAAGQLAYATEIILKAPSNKQRHDAAKLKQGFFRALKSMADGRGDVKTQADEAPQSDLMDGDEIMSVIMMSNVDLCEYQESFRNLLLNDACFVDNVKMTAPMFDKLTDADTEKMMGEYVANFLLASHLQKMKTK